MSVIASNTITLACIRDISAIYRFYRLQSSTSAAPSKPTSIASLPPSGWSASEPSYTEGSTNSLYTVDLTIYTDNTFNYSNVSLSSSYEASKQAYNKASAAQITANSVNTKIDNLEIGGRNLARHTSSEWRSQVITDGENKQFYLFPSSASERDDYSTALTGYGFRAGDVIQLSFDIKFSDDFTASGTGTKHSYIQGNKNWLGGSWASLSITGGNRGTAIEEIINGASKEGRVSTYFNITADMLDGTYTGYLYMAVRFDYYSGTVYVRNVMLEKASKPSGWSPAPEDVEDYADNAVEASSAILQETINTTIDKSQSDIMLAVESEYVKTSAHSQQITNIQSQLNLSNSNMTLGFTETKQRIEQVNTEINQVLERYGMWFSFDASRFEIGREGSSLKLRQTNEKISFMQGEVEVAYISNNKLYITEGQFLTSVQIGDYAFIPRSNGHLSFVYKGSDS